MREEYRGKKRCGKGWERCGKCLGRKGEKGGYGKAREFLRLMEKECVDERAME